MRAVIVIIVSVVVLGFGLPAGCQRRLFYFPSHDAASTVLAPWRDGTATIGYCHEAPHPANVWLMLHGNAGQASQRDYAVRHLSGRDSLYVLEYPGYGERPGTISRRSIDLAAADA